MFHTSFSRFSRLLAVAAVALAAACANPSSSGGGNGNGDKNAITGTVQFRANNGPVTHKVYMAAFFSHDGGSVVSSNIIDLGTTALQPISFSLTPDFPADAVPNDFMVFSAWVDLDDNGAFDGEDRQPVPTEGEDTVFLVGDSLIMYQADGWHFENDEGGVGDLYSAHNKSGTKLITVSMN